MAKFSADQVYALLSEHTLTAEQRQVIEQAPLDQPALVIAGAGSGKTELMTLRVLYLVANSIAKPSEILGLTFTRKAASELSGRVNQALYKLRETELWPKELELDFAPSNITTYNSFGNDIFRRLALSVGYEQDATLLSEAGSIALADELVKGLRLESFESLENWDKTKAHLIELILQFAQEMTDNQAEVDQVNNYLQGFIERVSHLPQTEKGGDARYGYTQELLDAAAQNQMLAELAGEYRSLKAKRHLVDFSDQVALALRAIPEGYDHGYQFVLLDEYQDTSAIQISMLARLFRKMPVLAVGDPNQAIYGWRGASSNNLTGFHADFGSTDSKTFTLSKSWRSGPGVVAAANLITEQLNRSQPDLAPVRLEPGRADAKDLVEAEVFQDEVQEARAVANWFEANLDRTRSAALLMRTKASMQLFADEIGARGIPVEVTGLSSLVQLPEVMDLIAALNVIHRPQAGAMLMRLLSGPKWRIAPKDLAALNDLAKQLMRIRKVPQSAQPISIVEALDELRFESTRKLGSFSELGLPRLVQAAQLLSQLRAKSSLSVNELCWAIVRELEIDIELYAHSNAANPLANLEAFIARISEYENSSLRPSLSGALLWLDQAVEKESFELPKSGAKQGVVQIMSVHASKGLEWDLVAVAGLNQGSFPIDGRGAKGWLAAAKLPFELRGDSNVLPVFDFKSAGTQRDLKKNFDLFQDANRQKALLEERRLAYVAFTRARQSLLITASHYKFGVKKPKALSPFLTELIEAKLAGLRTAISEPESVNPLDQIQQTKIWPFDPLGDQRRAIEAAAERVSSAEPARHQDFAELMLLLEEAERANWLIAPELPRRLSASKLMQLLTAPVELAGQLLRPLPSLFSDSADRGTKFHARLEQALLAGTELEISDWDEVEQELGVNFQNSRFAGATPVFVEQSIEFEIAGLIVVCKIDAVFETEFGYQVVDWKSGASPKSEAEIAQRSIQLALYRIAVSRWLQVPIERVTAAFYFAADGVEIAPDRLMSEAELKDRIDQARKARRD